MSAGNLIGSEATKGVTRKQLTGPFLLSLSEPCTPDTPRTAALFCAAEKPFASTPIPIRECVPRVPMSAHVNETKKPASLDAKEAGLELKAAGTLSVRPSEAGVGSARVPFSIALPIGNHFVDDWVF